MKVLVGCEFSGVVRRAFRDKGHDAYSCDLLDSEDNSPFHLKKNVLDTLDNGWDLAIFHPPCTHLAVSGARWFKGKEKEQKEAIDFFMALINAPIPKICVENPVCIMSRIYRKPDQIIQPYEFGDDASKKTCLWLKNLPTLFQYAQNYIPAKNGVWGNQTPSGQNKLGPSVDRWRERSRTYPGIAKAFAEQWG